MIMVEVLSGIGDGSDRSLPLGVAQLQDDFHNSFEKTFPTSPSLCVPVSTSIIRFLCNAYPFQLNARQL